MMKYIFLLVLFGCHNSSKQEFNTIKKMYQKQQKTSTIKDDKHHIKNIQYKEITSKNTNIETSYIEKQNILGYKVIVNEKECKFVFSLEYFLQQKAKQNRKLDLQEIRFNIGFYF